MPALFSRKKSGSDFFFAKRGGGGSQWSPYIDGDGKEGNRNPPSQDLPNITNEVSTESDWKWLVFLKPLPLQTMHKDFMQIMTLILRMQTFTIDVPNQ